MWGTKIHSDNKTIYTTVEKGKVTLIGGHSPHPCSQKVVSGSILSHSSPLLPLVSRYGDEWESEESGREHTFWEHER